MRNGLLTLLFMVFACALQAKTYVVCVGIADYPGTQNDLVVSANDAYTIYKVFSKSGQASAVYLTNSNATISHTIASMRQMFSQATAEDVIVFYFSGHGTPGAVVCYDGFFKYQSIFKEMARSKAKNKVLLIDACYSGKMRSTSHHDTSYSDQNVMLFLSSRTTEPSRETGFKNSLFTLFLERGLRGGADTDKNRTITAQELYQFVHPGVVEASNQKQHPVMWGKFDKNMQIIKW